MDNKIKLIYDTKRLMLTKYPQFGSDLASINIEYNSNLKYHTAATDGKTVYFDPGYLASLNEDDRLFLIAHELMHIKFAHTLRLLDKNGKKRDLDIWNEATDAIINANLERDGFRIKAGYINRPEALNYSAEEFYQILLKEKEEKQQANSQNNENNETENIEDNDKECTGDDHSLWEELFENSQTESQQSNDTDVNEREIFEQNRQERLARAKKNLEEMKEQLLKNFNNNSSNYSTIQLGDVGESKDEIAWELLLRREIEKSETIWSQRRSIAENNYAYRLEENDIDDEAETEVMIDVSGSVDLELVRGFLRALKPILKHSKLKVGCFNEKFWGMTEIKSISDIDNFVISEESRGHSAWTEDWDLAVRSFTKKREINKIVFTDGDPCPGTMPKEDLKNENIIWMVYGNQYFKPCCGKVIHITTSQLEKLSTHQLEDIRRCI